MTTEALDQDPAVALVRIWRGYASKVYGDDYPLYQSVARAIAGDPTILGMLQECPAATHDPNLLMAAIQYIVMGGSPHPLADLYARASDFRSEPVPAGLPAVVGDFCRLYRDEIVALLQSRHVQTNETGRCGAIALGLIEAARSIGQPVALIDAGASAGLNLALDEYLLDFGAAGQIGPAHSTVRLPCQVSGAPLPRPLVLPAIRARLGIDRAPVDLADEDTVRWMLACIWPGTGRQERARAAIALRAGRPGLVRRGDMVTDLGPALREMDPHPTVVVTSWSYSYLAPDDRVAFVEVLEEEGRRRPVAWVCCDLQGTVPMFDPPTAPAHGEPIPSVLGLGVFGPGGTRGATLGLMHSHGSWLRWSGRINT